MQNHRLTLDVDEQGLTFTGSAEETTDPASPVTDATQTWTSDLSYDPAEVTLTGTITSPGGAVYDVTGWEATAVRWDYADDTAVTLTANTFLDTAARVDSVDCAGFRLELRPGAALQSRGNVLAERLVMEPGSSLTFIEVDETAFVGGGMMPLASDVGLWFSSTGTLEAAGTPKTSWTTAAGAITAGASTVTCAAAPTGWLPGDVVAICPTLPKSHPDYLTAYDELVVQAVSGADVTFTTPLVYDHPSRDVWGTIRTAELLNLTRDIKIGGTPSGRSHVMFAMSQVQHHFSNVEFHDLGPVNPGASKYEKAVLGRWAVHWHHGGNGTDGSTVTGCVARNIGSHGFAPHKANGITFTDCVAHDVGLSGFWWDDEGAVSASGGPNKGDPSDRIVFDRCVASKHVDTLASDGNPAGFTHRVGFTMGNGIDNATTDCVAVGIETDWRFEGGGYSWQSNHSGVWATTGSCAHNCVKGIDLWSNFETLALVHDGMSVWDCADPIRDGAYRTTFGWSNTDVVGSMASRAGKRRVPWQQYVAAPDPDIDGLRIDADGADYCFSASTHHQDWAAQSLDVRINNAEFKGAAVACIRLGPHENLLPHRYIIGPGITFTGNEFWWDANQAPNSLVTLHQTSGPTLELRPVTYTGDTSGMTWRADWNCWELAL